MYIRWLGAFRKRSDSSLLNSIKYEFNREEKDEVAVEQLQNGTSYIRAIVGLLVDPNAIYKRFNGDVWSEYRRKRVKRTSETDERRFYKRRELDSSIKIEYELVANRKGYESHSLHKESWAHPVYTGICVQGSYMDLRKEIRVQIVSAHEETGLPVYELKKGKLNLIEV